MIRLKGSVRDDKGQELAWVESPPAMAGDTVHFTGVLAKMPVTIDDQTPLSGPYYIDGTFEVTVVEEDKDQYEKGYRDGLSSGFSEWMGEIGDHFPEEGIVTPSDLINWMRRTKNTIRVKPVDGELVNEEPVTLLVTANGWVKELKLALKNWVIDVAVEEDES